MSEDEQARIATIADEMAEIEAKFEAGLDDDGDADALEDRFVALEAELVRIQDKPGIVSDEMKPSVGCFVILDGEGRPVIDATLYSETTPRKQRSTATTGGAGEGNGAGDGTGDGEDGMGAIKPLSQRLIGELSVQRRDILASNLAVNPAVALDLLIFAIADRTPTYGRDDRGTTIRAPEPSCYLDTYPASPAFEQLAEIRDGLDTSWTEPETTVARFEAFAGLDDDAKAGWLAYVVAKSLEPSIGGARIGHQGPSGNDLHDHLAGLIQIDVAQHWRPNAANYFDRVGKQHAPPHHRHRRDDDGGELYGEARRRPVPDLRETVRRRDHRRTGGQGRRALPGCPMRSGSDLPLTVQLTQTPSLLTSQKRLVESEDEQHRDVEDLVDA
ncbi:MAG: hypothetical protein IPN84_17990 [Sphingomonadales bacterium]|nr:hypothetical protein [Sphingomonadales bacterium]